MAYFDNINVEVHAPDRMNIKGHWQDFPLDIAATVRQSKENKAPRINITEVNDIPLFFIGSNISQGINNGIDAAFLQSPVDVTNLIVQEGVVFFDVKKSTDDTRPQYGTPTPVPTATSTPIPTPTPVNVTLVVIFNDSDEAITLEIPALAGSWDIAPHDTQVLETPPGTYEYIVKYQGSDEIAAQGSRTWTLNKAYRLRIDFGQTENDPG